MQDQWFFCARLLHSSDKRCTQKSIWSQMQETLGHQHFGVFSLRNVVTRVFVFGVADLDIENKGTANADGAAPGLDLFANVANWDA